MKTARPLLRIPAPFATSGAGAFVVGSGGREREATLPFSSQFNDGGGEYSGGEPCNRRNLL
jgi:hypothetical protein